MTESSGLRFDLLRGKPARARLLSCAFSVVLQAAARAGRVWLAQPGTWGT